MRLLKLRCGISGSQEYRSIPAFKSKSSFGHDWKARVLADTVHVAEPTLRPEH